MHAATGNVPKLLKKRTEKVLFSMPGPSISGKMPGKKRLQRPALTLSFYACRERSTDEILPWDFLDIGVTKKFLIREWERAQKETVTPNCKMQCSGCGAKSFGGGVCYENQN